MESGGQSLRQPRYVLRGHTAAIHALAFSPDNSRVLTGDADGWIVSWELASRRPAATWRAHENAVLGMIWWGREAVISHGRDSKLVVWHMRPSDEEMLERTLPADHAGSHSAKPPILHELTVNTMNFCSFASCRDRASIEIIAASDDAARGDCLVVALPHTLDSEAIDLFRLPSTHRLSTIPVPKSFKSGMVMALHVYTQNNSICIVAGYESGHVAYYMCSTSASASVLPTAPAEPATRRRGAQWHCVYLSRPHTQPVLSIAASLDEEYVLTSAADSVIATHLLSSIVEGYIDLSASKDVSSGIEEPFCAITTGNPGQQGLSISPNGLRCASAGWDGKVRIFAWPTLKEEDILQWHRDGVYASAFAHESEADPEAKVKSPNDSSMQKRRGTLAVRREQRAKQTPWLAVGGKDGKVSLWEMPRS